MTRQEFIRIAREMRSLQRQFFRLKPADRPPNLLARARDAERRFDEALDQVAIHQRGLFDGEHEES
jgi:hypothetical protein